MGWGTPGITGENYHYGGGGDLGVGIRLGIGGWEPLEPPWDHHSPPPISQSCSGFFGGLSLPFYHITLIPFSHQIHPNIPKPQPAAAGPGEAGEEGEEEEGTEKKKTLGKPREMPLTSPGHPFGCAGWSQTSVGRLGTQKRGFKSWTRGFVQGG